MKILFLTFGDKTVASSRTRVFQYLPYLQKYNISHKVISAKSLVANSPARFIKFILVNFFIGLKFLFFCPFYEIIFIQKILLPRMFLRAIKLFGRKLVFDFDDAVYLLPTPSERFTAQTKTSITANKFRDIVSFSNLIIVENEYTKEYAEPYNANIVQITGPIDTARYFPKEKSSDGKIIIGWIGSPTTTCYLNMVFPVLEKLSTQYPNITLKLIGASEIGSVNFPLTKVPWSLETEVKELQEFDIGIMPLPDDAWTKGKGGYKLLQYMAIGIPSVSSPVGINTTLIQNRINGFLAKDESEWYEKLSSLIRNSEERHLLGKKARQIAEQVYSFDIATPKLIEALSKLCSNSSRRTVLE